MSRNNTQLNQAENYDVNRLIFTPSQVSTIPSVDPKDPPLSYQRIGISTKNLDGTTGELIFQTEWLFSFGVSPNKDRLTGALNGYSLPLCMWDMEGSLNYDPEVNKKQKAYTTTHTNLVEKCKDHLLSVKREIKKFDLERSDLKKFGGALYWKKDKETGELVDKYGPSLYPKLFYSKNRDEISTPFSTEDGEELNPLDLVGKNFRVMCAIKYESIFIGKDMSLQYKVYQAYVRFFSTGFKSILPACTSKVEPQNTLEKKVEEKLNDDSDSEDEMNKPILPVPESVPLPPKPVGKVVRRVVKK